MRSWRISVVAVLTLAVSLFLCGLFLLVLQNLSSTIEGWRSGLRVVVYLEEEVSDAESEELSRLLASPAWVRSVEPVDAGAAAERFESAFPALSNLTTGWDESPFPASLEAVLDPARLEGEDEAFEAWLTKLGSGTGAAMVDADRDWLNQLSTLLGFVGAAALALGLTFLLAAAITAASMLRLVAYLQREETAIMRLVGATEFYIRGPFLTEGLLYGFTGAATALLALAALVAIAGADGSEVGLWSDLLFSDFLQFRASSALLAAGSATGLGGAIVSLRRERAESTATDL